MHDKQSDATPKTTLFCQDCGHQSPYDGDWTQIRSGNKIHYLCPDCRTEITVRSAPPQTPPLSPSEVWKQWSKGLEAMHHLWRKSFSR
jgi:uncharacterized protein YlaI